MFAYCNNNPVRYSDPLGNRYIEYADVIGLSYDSDYMGLPVNVKDSPPDHPDYKPPKGGSKMRKNPNGKGWGWESKDGGIWVWTPGMHGGEGWTIQYPGGTHGHAYPGGGTRKHFKSISLSSPYTIQLVGLLAFGAIIVDDLSGVGIANNTLIPACLSLIYVDFTCINFQICLDCGEIIYGNE